MEKLKMLLVVMVPVLCLSVATPVYAASLLNDACNQVSGSQQPAACADKDTTSNPLTGPSGTIAKVTNIMSVVAGAVAVIMIIVGGLMYVLSGNSSNTNTARETIIYAVIGLVVIAVAQSIVVFVVDRL